MKSSHSDSTGADDLSASSTDEADAKTTTMKVVAITILSLTGVVSAKYPTKKKNLSLSWMKKKKNTDAATFFVASIPHCSISVEDGATLPLTTHLPSFPVDVSRSQPIVRWKSHLGNLMSTCRFSLQLQPRGHATTDNEEEEDGKRKYMPQTCPITIAMLRKGELVPLGQANIIITGEEKEDARFVAPASRTYINKQTGDKNFRIESSKEPTLLARIKGDDLLFGMKSDATLRVLVSVTDASVMDDADHVQESALPFNDVDNSYDNFLYFLNGGMSARDMKNMWKQEEEASDGVEKVKEQGGAENLDETLPSSDDESDSDEVNEQESVQMVEECQLKMLTTTAHSASDDSSFEKCAHGCPALLENNIIHTFLNAFIVGYNDAIQRGEVDNSFVVAIMATRDAYSEVWNDPTQLCQGVKALIYNASENILHGNLRDARHNAAFACFFEQWIDFLAAKTNANRSRVAELLTADVNTIVSFLNNRIFCSCLRRIEHNDKAFKIKKKRMMFSRKYGHMVH